MSSRVPEYDKVDVWWNRFFAFLLGLFVSGSIIALVEGGPIEDPIKQNNDISINACLARKGVPVMYEAYSGRLLFSSCNNVPFEWEK